MAMANKTRCFFLLLSTLYLNDINSLLAVNVHETQEESVLKHNQEERLSEGNLYVENVEQNIIAKDYVDNMKTKSSVHETHKLQDDSGSTNINDEDGVTTPHMTNSINSDSSQKQLEHELEAATEEDEFSTVSPANENSVKNTAGITTIDKDSENDDRVISDSDEKSTNDDSSSSYHEDFNQEMKTDAEGDNIGLKKHRHFSLLYTFGTLFNSLLSEFGDVSGHHDAGHNSSEKEIKNSSTLDEVLSDTNTTSNNTDSGKKTRFQCAVRNVTEDTTFEVKIVNSTELLEILNFSKNQKLSPCVLVMFYAPWCYFCAKTAPHYNALARAFPQLNILAVDTSHFSYLNARFGTVAVPNVMLFHSRSAVRFNHTTRDLDHFIQFVTNNTGLESNKSVLVEPFDYEGPLSSQVEQKRDWLLWAAWAFVIVCSAYFFIGSLYGQAFITRIRVLWQEHQHIE